MIVAIDTRYVFWSEVEGICMTMHRHVHPNWEAGRRTAVVINITDVELLWQAPKDQ